MNNNKIYVVFDIETTGLSPNLDKITEIGAVKIKDGTITEEYHQLIDPKVPIPRKITELTGITSEMLEGKPTIEEVLPSFMNFCLDCEAVVAHNARFDMGFINHNATQQGLNCNFEVFDTLSLSRRLFPYLPNHKLGTVARHLGVKIKDQHRATGDARATTEIFMHCMEIMEHKKKV